VVAQGVTKHRPLPISKIGHYGLRLAYVTRLNAAGHRTGKDRQFDIDAVQWVRHVHKIPTPGPLAPGELIVAQAADRLSISAHAVYHWIKAGHLPARRGTGNRLAITWTDDLEAYGCREPCHVMRPARTRV